MEDPGRASTATNAPPGMGLIGGYRPIPGAVDAMVDAEGRPRPGWATLIAALEQPGPETPEQRFARADRYLRDAGVYYRLYGRADGAERQWPLAHLPLLIDEEEWQAIAAGVVQRAELLERVVADIYGENRLVADGLLPPELIVASPEFLRPLVGVKPAGGHFLHFCAFELGRGPDGRWWVLGDRTQAPSGAGFALETRAATSLALGDALGRLAVRPLTGFFREFRDALLDRGRRMEGRAALLSPGPHNETYYEHAWLARWLGIMLLQGEDLTVRDGRLLVRTVAGAEPVTVLWRRLDAAFADPLELLPGSELGTPGLVEAVRCGTVCVVNALGSGVLETRALLAFLPRIAEALDAPLMLPNIATWWCGEAAARDHVERNLDALTIGPALSTRPGFEDDAETRLGARLDAAAEAALRARLRQDGASVVAQETVTLSTTPVHVGGVLEPRPVCLRVFAARTERGWTVMPGGFARVGFSLDTRAIAMQNGGQAADVWVLARTPAETAPGPARAETRLARETTGALPARAADSLFWLGRYAERVESSLRLLRAYHVRLAETGRPELPILADIRLHLARLGLAVEPAIPPGLVASVESAVASAAQVRDRFAPDGWLALADLARTIREFAARVLPGDDASRGMTVLLRKLSGFSGLAHENMYRSTGWRFLEIGRRLERAIQTAWTLAWLTRDDAPDGAADLAVEIGDSLITHRRRYSADASRLSVLDLLALDSRNPRSIAFQAVRIREEVAALPGRRDGAAMPETEKAAVRLETALRTAEPEELTPVRLNALASELMALSDALTRAHLA